MKKRLEKISKYRPSLFQGRMDFAGVPQHFSLSAEHPLEQRFFQALCLLLGVLIFGYLYFVSASVFNIMARKEADATVASIQSSIASLESKYFALQQSVDAATASSLGLAPLTQTQYVYVPGNAAAAGSATDNEI